MDLALFDLDETVICEDSASLWLRWLVEKKLAPLSLLKKEQELMKDYYRGQLSMECYMHATLAPLVGYSTQEVTGWVESFIQQEILPRVYPQAREQLDWHRQRGDHILIISASGEHLVAPIARQLGADTALAIGVALKDNRITGETYGVLTFREGKVLRINEWLNNSPHLCFSNTYGYSDSINDRPMLEFVDYATVINPNNQLADLAILHDWNIAHWHGKYLIHNHTSLGYETGL